MTKFIHKRARLVRECVCACVRRAPHFWSTSSPPRRMLRSSRLLVRSSAFCSRSLSTTTNTTTTAAAVPVEEFAIQSTLFSTDAKRLTVGETASVRHAFRQEIVNQFATLCGDNNPLHTNPEFAKTTMFGGTIVHGIFVTSLFSTLFGRSINGSIYVSQTVNFKRAVHVGKPVTATIEVKSVEAKKKGDLVTCSTVCVLEDGAVAIDGEAKVLLPPGAFKAI